MTDSNNRQHRHLVALLEELELRRLDINVGYGDPNARSSTTAAADMLDELGHCTICGLHTNQCAGHDNTDI